MPVNTARFLIDVKKHWGALEEESWLIYSSRGWYPPQQQAAEEPHTVDAEADSIHDYSGSVKSWPEHTNA